MRNALMLTLLIASVTVPLAATSATAHHVPICWNVDVDAVCLVDEAIDCVTTAGDWCPDVKDVEAPVDVTVDHAAQGAVDAGGFAVLP